MDDLIDRQKAIKDAESWVAVDEYEKHLQKKVVEWLKEFPSAELVTNLAEVGTDCISRQDAIEALNKLSESTYEVSYGVVDCDDAINAIAALPLTEPKKGKWIKSGRWGRVYKCNQCGNFLDFDGVNAGRGSTNFCPNCGSYNGGENEI